MSAEAMEAYTNHLASLSYPALAKEHALIEMTYERMAAALPEWRLVYATYPHPVLQRRLLILNAMYNRTVSGPKVVHAYHRNRAILEGSLAGGVIGGVVAAFSSKPTTMGVLIGAALGAVAGSNELIRTTITDITGRAMVF
jgi:hypothetical protein